MARPMSDFTIAIRELCDSNGFDINHETARPLLAEKGIELVAEPNWKMDDEVKAWHKKAKEFIDGTQDFDANSEVHQKWLADNMVAALGLSAIKLKSMQKELAVREAYTKERQRFDVQKSNYNVSINGSSRGSKSSKPASGKDTTPRVRAGATVAATTGRRVGRPAKVNKPVVTSGGDSLGYISAMGGMAAAKKKLAELQSEITEIEAHIAAAVEQAKATLSEAEAA